MPQIFENVFPHYKQIWLKCSWPYLLWFQNTQVIKDYCFGFRFAHMVECHQPEQKSVEALENSDFVYALISRRLKLHS